jgi:hypothetical protein
MLAPFEDGAIMRRSTGLAVSATHRYPLSPVSFSCRASCPFTVAVPPLTMPAGWPNLSSQSRLHRVLMAPSPLLALVPLRYLPDTMDSTAGSWPPLAAQKVSSGLTHTSLPSMTIWKEPPFTFDMVPVQPLPFTSVREKPIPAPESGVAPSMCTFATALVSAKARVTISAALMTASRSLPDGKPVPEAPEPAAGPQAASPPASTTASAAAAIAGPV